MNEDLYIMWLSRIKGINEHKTERLIEYFGSAKEIYNACGREICNIIDEKTACNIVKASSDGSFDKLITELENSGVQYVSKYNKSFPERLKNIDDVPLGIYYIGILPGESTRTVAIVGSRRCTEYGKHAALTLAGELSDCGIAIVSGLADGIDSYAHIGCLKHNGTTIAVLGTAINKCYPASNKGLMDKIIETGGCIISEYGPNQATYASDFVRRNRIIAGLSEVLIVAEAEIKSGTNSTVNAAMSYGRSVFAVPGSIFSKYSEGTNRLIRDGCPPVLCSADILLDMKIYEKPAVEETKKEDMNVKLNGVSETGKKIIDALGKEPIGFEVLAAKTGIQENKLRSELTLLEIRKLIAKVPGQKYILVL